MGGKDQKISFIFETKNKILAQIHNLDNKKAYQESHTLMKIIKVTDIFSEFVFYNFNNSIFEVIFPLEWRNAVMIPVILKKSGTMLKTIVQ